MPLISLTTSRFAHEFRFLRAFAANPRGVGAIAPSGAALSRAMAAQIDPALPGHVVELGPGTGSITEAILARGVPKDRFTTVEYDPELARLIAKRFAGLDIVVGDGFDFENLLADRLKGPCAAIVSGLPLLNFPMEKRISLIDRSLTKLHPGAPFILFSYGLHAPVAAFKDVKLTMARLVWKNLPPARVWVYRRF